MKVERNFKREIEKVRLNTLFDEIKGYPSEEKVGESFEKIIRSCVDETSRLCSIAERRGLNLESELKNLKTKLLEEVYKLPINNGLGHQLKRDYARLLSIGKDLTTENIQKSDLDISERYRYLVFRISTAAGIASVVLFTGLMSKIFDIPLPMLK
jgi:hypothetical protein